MDFLFNAMCQLSERYPLCPGPSPARGEGS